MVARGIVVRQALAKKMRQILGEKAEEVW